VCGVGFFWLFFVGVCMYGCWFFYDLVWVDCFFMGWCLLYCFVVLFFFVVFYCFFVVCFFGCFWGFVFFYVGCVRAAYLSSSGSTLFLLVWLLFCLFGWFSSL